jgi:hypothetical protein
LKERCRLEARTNFFSFKKVAKTRCGLDSRIYGIWDFVIQTIYLHSGGVILVVAKNLHLVLIMCYKSGTSGQPARGRDKLR